MTEQSSSRVLRPVDYHLSQLPPLSLYIHIPWCVRKCPYCDFNSHQAGPTLPEEEYINALLQDLAESMPLVWGRQLSSIFIGGGTPSLLSGEGIEKLLSGVRALLPFTADMEVTMEANPGTAEASRFAAYKAAGVNRLSIGVQSFDDKLLNKLGRIHSALEARRAYEMARNAGFENINLDLMYALPQQTLNQALADLKIAIELAPEHLSWYQLTLEPNTAFYQSPPSLPDDDQTATMSEAGLQQLADSHYCRYEISAFHQAGAKPSQHNLNYWQFGDYLGIGAGAHQKISRADEQSICRSSKWRNPKDYLNPDKSFIATSKILSAAELPLEFMLNAMRLKNGVSLESFKAHTGLFVREISQAINNASEAGLLIQNQQQIKATDSGYLFLNELLNYFLPENFEQLANKKLAPVATTLADRRIDVEQLK